MGVVLQQPTPADRVKAGPSFYTTPQTEEGGFWDAAGAAYVNENSIGSWVADMEFQVEADAVEGYDQYQDIPEDLSDMPFNVWRGVQSPEEMEARVSEIYAERERLDIINTSGWGAFVGGMAGILTSPEIIPDFFVGRGAGALRGAIKLGASTIATEGAHEYIMHQQNFTRTQKETYLNMGLSAFGGAAVGGFISRKASKGTLDFMRADLEDSATPEAYVDSSVWRSTVYHGSPEKFKAWDVSKINSDDPDDIVNGLWFTTKRSEAESAGRFPYGRPNAEKLYLYEVDVALKNPASRKDLTNAFKEAGKRLESEDYSGSRLDLTREILLEKGFDGHVRFTKKVDVDEFLKTGKTELGNGQYLEKNTVHGGVDLYDSDGMHITGYLDIEDAKSQLQEDEVIVFDPEAAQIISRNDEIISPDKGDSVGAAKVDFASISTREMNEQYQGEAFLNKPWLNWRWLGPVRPLIYAAENIPVVGKILNDVAEHSYSPLKTKENVAKQFAAETEVNQEIGSRMRTVTNTLNENYKKWLKDTGRRRVRDFRKNWTDFNKEIHRALVGGDQSSDELIKQTAKVLRSQFNELLATAKKYDPDGKWLSVDEAAVKYADSYAPRRYNRRKIQKNPTTFKRMLAQSFIDERELKAFDEAREAAAEVGEEFTQTVDDFRVTDLDEIADINKQVDKTYDRIAYGYDEDVYMPISSSGKAYEARKVPIQDKDLIEGDWLESDLEAMMRSYSNRVLKPARLLQRGYDPELKDAIAVINDSYRAKTEGLDDAAADALNQEGKKVVETFELIRDRYYGRTTISSSKQAEAVNDVMRTIRNINVARMMGMVLPISMGDVFRANLTTIYAPELGKAAPGLIDAIKTAKASKPLMQAFGVAHETAMMVRTGKILDDSGLEGTSLAVTGSAELSRGLMKSTGLMPWTDWGKLLAASYTQNDIAQKMLGYGKLSSRSKKQLADLGIDEKTAIAFQEEIAKKTGGITRLKKNTTGYEATGYVFDYAKWENKELADTVQKTLFRESERNIVTPAVGEVPRLTQSDEVNKMIFQFQSFLFGAAHSVTVNLAKRLADRDPKGFVIMTQLMLGGMVSVGLRESLYGNIEELQEWTPQDWALNSLDYSSGTPLAMMAFNKINLGTGNALTNMLGASTMSRYAHRPLMSLAGPSAGTSEDVLLSMQAALGIPFGQELTPADVRRMRRLIPWNNYALFAAPVSKAQEAIEESVE